MKLDEMFQVFKEIYYFELDHKYKIDSSLNLPTNSIVLIIPAIFYVYKNFIKVNPIISTIMFSLISIFILLAIYYLLRCYIRHKYNFLPNYNILYDQLLAINKNHNESIVYDELIKLYIAHNEPNKNANLKRLNLLYKCKICILMALILLVLFTLFYFMEVSV